MAVSTATLTLNPASSAVNNQKVTGIFTITNGNTTPQKVTSFTPYAFSTGGVKSVYNTGVSFSVPNIGPSANLTVPGSGTLVITFDMIFAAPSSGTLSNVVETYSVNAACYLDDGLGAFVASDATITINFVETFSSAQS